MTYDFDQIIPRNHTNSLKYDFAKERGKPDGLLPMWVADMDFQTPLAVREALADKAAHGIFGYSEPDDAYFEALAQWFGTRHNWTVDPYTSVRAPGVVFAICTLIRCLTQPGDAVLIQEPVYYCFREGMLTITARSSSTNCSSTGNNITSTSRTSNGRSLKTM